MSRIGFRQAVAILARTWRTHYDADMELRAKLRPPRGHGLTLALAALAACLATRPATAMQFERVELKAGAVMLAARGPIIAGDFQRFRSAIAAIPQGQSLRAIAVDSPGGSVLEADRIAQALRQLGLTIIVPPDSKCVSACFLLLAAAPRKLAAADALIGVHSANQDGTETEASRSVTVEMARLASAYGVPPGILGKMVQTTPQRVEWLTQADLASMGVVIYDRNRTADAVGSSSADLAPAPPPPAVRQPPGGIAPGAAPAEPPAVPAGAAAVAFRGALFCGQRPATLHLRLIQPGAPGHSQAVLSVGPTAANPNVVASSEAVAGLLDIPGGLLELQPASPTKSLGALPPLGLKGRSDDGGRTFSGTVLGSPACTLFTLRRMP